MALLRLDQRPVSALPLGLRGKAALGPCRKAGSAPEWARVVQEMEQETSLLGYVRGPRTWQESETEGIAQPPG